MYIYEHKVRMNIIDGWGQSIRTEYEMSASERGQIYVAISGLILGFFHEWQGFIDASAAMFLGMGIVYMIWGFKK